MVSYFLKLRAAVALPENKLSKFDDVVVNKTSDFAMQTT